MQSTILVLAALCGTTLAQSTSSGLEPGAKIPYLFSAPGNVIFGLLYLFLALAHFWLLFKSKARWTMVLPIAEVFSALGFFLRVACRSNQQSIMLYAICNLFVILAPAAFLAFNYMMFSRLIVSLDDELTSTSKRRTKSKYSPIPPRIFGPLFVWSDVITFLIQAGGGGMQAAGGDLSKTGSKIFLVGVILQAISYIIFIILFTISHMRLRREGTSSAVAWLFIGLYFASVCILIRSFFRIVEMAEGYDGKLYRTEVYLFVLDALPLVFANLTWVFLWPPTYFKKDEISRNGTEKDLVPLNDFYEH